MDLIDRYRQAAIDAFNDIASDLHARKRLDEEYIALWCAETIEQLPSAQPQRMRGKWITQEFGSWAKCSECHELYDIPIANSNFCPNCGADMRGGEQNG